MFRMINVTNIYDAKQTPTNSEQRSEAVCYGMVLTLLPLA